MLLVEALELVDYLVSSLGIIVSKVINKLEGLYKRHISELNSTDEYKQQTTVLVKEVFDYLRSFTKQVFTSIEERIILAQGEIISTNMVTNYLKEQGISAHLIAALDYMRTDKNGEPDAAYIKEKITDVLANSPKAQIYITQGFICRNINGEIDNLQRGGSDYTASLVGAAIGASEIQIWTDIDGMHNNDPRIVEGTTAVRHLHFEEAAELGYFGAKRDILFVSSLFTLNYCNSISNTISFCIYCYYVRICLCNLLNSSTTIYTSSM